MGWEDAFKELEKAAKTPRAHGILKTLHSELEGGTVQKSDKPLSPGQKAAQAGGGGKPFGQDPKSQAAARMDNR